MTSRQFGQRIQRYADEQLRQALWCHLLPPGDEARARREDSFFKERRDEHCDDQSL